jgi:cytochrome c oxidase assembly protein subunit 15
MYRRWLHAYALLVVLSTIFLIVAGAAVTSHEAGLSVPDWPLSYGKVMPEMSGMVFYEHGHRMVASVVGFLTVILALLLWRFEERRWVRRLGFAALALVIVQGLLGGLTVLLKLPPEVSIAHASTAQLFFTCTAAIALFTSRGFLAGPEFVADGGWPSLRSLAMLTPAAIYAQLLMGAAFRHKAAGLVPHLVGALVVFSLALMLGIFVLQQAGRNRHLRPWAIAVCAILSVQVVLGLAAYWTRLAQQNQPGAETPGVMVFFTVAHVATGAVALAVTSMLSIQVLRNVQKRVPAAKRQPQTASALS